MTRPSLRRPSSLRRIEIFGDGNGFGCGPTDPAFDEVERGFDGAEASQVLVAGLGRKPPLLWCGRGGQQLSAVADRHDHVALAMQHQ
jgi:hypothetical protein